MHDRKPMLNIAESGRINSRPISVLGYNDSIFIVLRNYSHFCDTGDLSSSTQPRPVSASQQKTRPVPGHARGQFEFSGVLSGWQENVAGTRKQKLITKMT